MIQLPIDDLRDELAKTFCKSSRLILVAAPGSGKSTRVPYYLNTDLNLKGKIIVLQPRRAAAMMLAKRVCEETQTKLKDLIGYQVKNDSQVQTETKVIYMTPGIFLRKCLDSKYLAQISCLILDEIHERSLELDLCLTISLAWQKQNPDLKCLAMSATLDESSLSKTFQAPILRCKHKPHTLEIIHQSLSVIEAIRDHQRQFKNKAANILIFESGQKEIRTILQNLKDAGIDKTHECFALYGNMPLSEQKNILSSGSKPRIIVATNIAETSLTIPGVSVVIDTGQCKLLRRDISSGANQLKKEWISKDRADQRAGRAARTGPGVAYRLWSRQQQHALMPYTDPEILRCDINSFVLWLAAYQIPIHKAELLTKPSDGALEKCHKELTHLNLIEESFKLTPLGKACLTFPLHPKFSVIFLKTHKRDIETCSRVMTYLEGQVPHSIYSTHQNTHLFEDLIERLDKEKQPLFIKESKRLQQLYSDSKTTFHSENNTSLEDCCIQSIPEQLCFLLPSKDNQYRVLGGGTGLYHCEKDIKYPSILWAAKIHFKSKNTKNANLQWIIPLSEKRLLTLFPNHTHEEKNLIWNEKTQSMFEQTSLYFIKEVKLKQSQRQVEFSHHFIETISKMILNDEIHLPRWSEEAQSWLLRYHLYLKHFPELDLLQFDKDDLLLLIEEAISSISFWEDLKNIDWIQTLQSALSWTELQDFEANFPDKFQLHSKRKVKIQYFEDDSPLISSKLQDFYDLKQHPSICQNEIQLRCELLAPNQRPVQTTQNIMGFWDGSYQQVKKELFRRYPKHEWR